MGGALFAQSGGGGAFSGHGHVSDAYTSCRANWSKRADLYQPDMGRKVSLHHLPVVAIRCHLGCSGERREE